MGVGLSSIPETVRSDVEVDRKGSGGARPIVASCHGNAGSCDDPLRWLRNGGSLVSAGVPLRRWRRNGLGGLNSSVSQATRVEACSWQCLCRTISTRLNVDEIAPGRSYLRSPPFATPSRLHLSWERFGAAAFGPRPPHGRRHWRRRTDTDREFSANFDRQASGTNSVSFLGLSPPQACKTVSFFVSFHRGATQSGILFLVSIDRETSRRVYDRRPWLSECDTRVSRKLCCSSKGGDNTCCSASSLLPRRASLATGRCEALGTTYPHPSGWRPKREPKPRLPAPRRSGTRSAWYGQPR